MIQQLLGGTQAAIDSQITQDAIAAATRPIQEQLFQQTIPGIQDQYVGAGQQGSARQGVSEGLAIQGAQQATGDVATQIAARTAEQARQQQLQTLLAQPQLQQLFTQPGQTLFGTGQQALGNYVNQLAALSGAAGGTTAGTTTTQRDPLSQALGYGLAGASLFL